MSQLGDYELKTPLTNQNAGYSVWGIGLKNGVEYFIKQFVDQKYPANDTNSSPERLAKKMKQCEVYEARKKALYQALNENSDGNAVRVEEFFRVESKYYIAMKNVKSLGWNISDVTALPQGEIRRLCSIIAHGVAGLHKGRIIHADLKPDNIIFTKTDTGYSTAKIIDFDSGFLETDPPAPGEDIVGDFHYFSPEACLSIWGEETVLTCKMDIFALGVLFHQFFTGLLPDFDSKESSYSGEAAAKGETLTVSDKLPEDLQELLTQMLCSDPESRPTAMEVFYALRRIHPPVESHKLNSNDENFTSDKTKRGRENSTAEKEETISVENYFSRPGDLTKRRKV